MVKALKAAGLVCQTSHAADINVGKIIRKAQEQDFIEDMVKQDMAKHESN